MTLLKGSFRTLASYSAGVFLFSFFLIAPLSMENNRSTWISVYSLVFFIFTVIFIYQQLRKIGEFESVHSEKKTTPFKGLIYGFLGFSPFLVLELIYFLVFPILEGTSASILHAIFRCGFGPMYFIIRFLGYTWYAHVLASVIIPIVAFLGYAAGFMGKELKHKKLFSGKKDLEDFLND
ncbi:MAG: hypothetical protein JW903_09335 [Clostridia bacterium]|nr:hypothetical protein [Clostridia bacterium]